MALNRHISSDGGFCGSYLAHPSSNVQEDGSYGCKSEPSHLGLVEGPDNRERIPSRSLHHSSMRAVGFGYGVQEAGRFRGADLYHIDPRAAASRVPKRPGTRAILPTVAQLLGDRSQDSHSKDLTMDGWLRRGGSDTQVRRLGDELLEEPGRVLGVAAARDDGGAAAGSLNCCR